jgi:hypothetical protein
MNGLDFSNNKTQKLIIAVVIIILFIFGLALLVKPRTQPTNGNEYFPAYGPAILKNSGDLYSSFDGYAQFNLLREDINLFGRKTTERFSNEKIQVMFVVSSYEINGNEIRISGEYEDSDKAEIIAEKKPNSRIKLSIKNKSNGKEIDNELTSNSKENDFISSLPTSNEFYLIEYDKDSDGYIIKLYNPTYGEEAIDYIVKGSGNTNAIDRTKIVPLENTFRDRINLQ